MCWMSVSSGGGSIQNHGKLSAHSALPSAFFRPRLRLRLLSSCDLPPPPNTLYQTSGLTVRLKQRSLHYSVGHATTDGRAYSQQPTDARPPIPNPGDNSEPLPACEHHSLISPSLGLPAGVLDPTARTNEIHPKDWRGLTLYSRTAAVSCIGET